MVFKTNYRLMQVKSIAECWEHSVILSTIVKLLFVIKIFVFSIFEWLYCMHLGLKFQFSCLEPLGLEQLNHLVDF